MGKRTNAEAGLAHISPAVLSWAVQRDSRSREELSRALKVDVAQFADWESGASLPTFDQAVSLSKQLSIPLGYLFLSAPPQRKLTVPDRRSLSSAKPLTANFRLLLNDVLVRQDWYRQHVSETISKPLPFVGSVSVTDDPQAVAKQIRLAIRLTPDERRHSYNWSDYLGRFAACAESAGILVMRSGVVGNLAHRKIDSLEVQGFALADPMAPVVYVNSSDFVTARIFTLAHELAHIWLGESAITDTDQGESSRSDAVESFCDKVATEILVPQSTFRVVWRQTLEAERVQTLVKKYWVSARVILRRARELGLISFDEYQTLRAEAIAAETLRQKSNKVDYFGSAIARVGRRLTDAVLSDVAKGSTSIVEGASLLAMSVNTFAEFAEGHY